MASPFLDQLPSRLLRWGVLAAPVACLVGVFLFTVGTDEAWIVAGVRGLAEHGKYGAESPFRSVHSTGGAFTAVATVFHVLGGGRIEIIRLLSVAGIVVLLLLSARLAARALGRGSEAPWFMGAALLAVPGTFLLGSLAFGEVLSVVLVVAGAVVWSAGTRSWPRRIWVGVILGTAAATRLNCLLAIAALPIAAFLVKERRKAEVVDALVAAAIGAAIFFVESQAQVWISVDPEASSRVMQTSGFTVDSHANPAYLIPLLLNHWTIANGFLPLFVIVAIVAGWAWARSRVDAPQGADVLLVFSVLMWGAWLVKAPIPHLRYLWPALAGFALVGGLVLAVAIRQPEGSGSAWLRRGLGWFGVSLLVFGYVEAARLYQHGENDILSWQLHRATPNRIEFGPLRALRSQKSFVHRLGEIPRDQVIATLGFDTALTYLARRTIIPVSAYYPGPPHPDLQPLHLDPNVKPRWLAVTPFIDRFPSGQMTPVLHRWIEGNCRRDCQFGPYVLYEVTGTYPESPQTFDLDAWAPKLPLAPPAR